MACRMARRTFEHRGVRGGVQLPQTEFAFLCQRANARGVEMKSEVYVLILAGGSGERFWPVSRRARPKQLLSLFGESSLLEATVARLEGFVPAERILILTNSEQESSLRALGLPIPAANILAEPAKRDTAPAIALGVGWIAARNPDAVMVVLPADHVIADREAFQSTLGKAVEAAVEGQGLVTIGIPPTWPCPGFGYIELGESWRGRGSAQTGVFTVARFREKPDAALAAEFLERGGFRWNAGMFVWTLGAIRGAFAAFAPELEGVVQDWPKGTDLGGWLSRVFAGLPKISIDYAVLEKADRVLAVEAGFDWDDVGSWTAVAKYLPADGQGNAGNCGIHALESEGNLVFSEEKGTVALLGVRDLIVVRAGDALLICHRRDAERVKLLMPGLPESLL